jgi:ubiquinone/menaquinone biosynthesis C-methylase UbiE
MKKELEDAGFVNVRIINFSLGAAGLHIARKPE